MAEITRRKFMGDGAVLLGSAVLTASAGGALLPLPAGAAGVDFPESNCGPANGDRRSILVAYASMSGSTGEVAGAVGRALCGPNITVDIRLIGKVTDISTYDAVIIGSAIRSSRWLPEAESFLRENRKRLRNLPVAYFLSCLTLAKPGEEPRRMARAMMEPLLKEVPEVRPLGLGLFAGVLDYSKFGFGMRTVLRYKMWSKGVREGDYRDWTAIRKWALSLGPLIDVSREKARAA